MNAGEQSNTNVGPRGDRPLRLSDFDYALPPERIATEPVRPRDRARLLLVDRERRSWTDSRFSNLAQHLDPSDLVVLNDTRVLKARLFGTLERTGRKIEILCANPVTRNCWQAMLHPGRRVRDGDRIEVGASTRLAVAKSSDEGLWQLALESGVHQTIADLLEADGHVPLPPYIRRAALPEDLDDYQTVYASQPGSIAAPTAGLHFSETVLASIRDRGIETAALTLHVGAGTFTPVRTEDPTRHRLQPEQYAISPETAARLNDAHGAGRRIIAVGTTTTRTLEYVFERHGRFVPETGRTDLFILPGFSFAAVDGLLTNFHLPRSTLLLLVSAFASRRLVLDAYQHAIDTGYRFYSYGDCTLFL